MRILSTGIYCEGPTDFEFLSAIVVRMAIELLEEKGRRPARVADPLYVPGRPSHDRVEPATEMFCNSIDVLVVHTDGKGSPDRARAERITPWFRSIGGIFDGVKKAAVAAVPVHETEAWMLADVDALNVAFGTAKTKAAFGLPSRSRDVESVQDPKKLLRTVQEVAIGRRQAKRMGMRPLYAKLGETVGLRRLRGVPAFGRLAKDFESAGKSLGFLR